MSHKVVKNGLWNTETVYPDVDVDAIKELLDEVAKTEERRFVLRTGPEGERMFHEALREEGMNIMGVGIRERMEPAQEEFNLRMVEMSEEQMLEHLDNIEL